MVPWFVMKGKLGFMNRQGQYVIQPGNYEAW